MIHINEDVVKGFNNRRAVPLVKSLLLKFLFNFVISLWAKTES